MDNLHDNLQTNLATIVIKSFCLAMRESHSSWKTESEESGVVCCVSIFDLKSANAVAWLVKSVKTRLARFCFYLFVDNVSIWRRYPTWWQRISGWRGGKTSRVTWHGWTCECFFLCLVSFCFTIVQRVEHQNTCFQRSAIFLVPIPSRPSDLLKVLIRIIII